jgi:hypothetical protein
MDLIEVRARDCACPGAPHAGGDIVSLRPQLSLAGGLAAQADIIGAAGDGSTLAQRWLVTYVTHGAIGWNLVDEYGKDVPFDVATLLADYSFALPVAERADELYSPSVIDPLTRRLGETSRTGRTVASTSPRAQSIRKRRGSSSPATSGALMRLTG